MAREAPCAVAGDGLLHPMALVSIALLLLNDHVLKAAAPGVVTGKLSDIAGLAFFPLLLQAAWEWLCAALCCSTRPSRRVLSVAVVATAAVFIAVELSTTGDALYRVVGGHIQGIARDAAAAIFGAQDPPSRQVAHVMDAGDVLTLPALTLPIVTGSARCARAEPRRVIRGTRILH